MVISTEIGIFRATVNTDFIIAARVNFRDGWEEIDILTASSSSWVALIRVSNNCSEADRKSFDIFYNEIRMELDA